MNECPYELFNARMFIRRIPDIRKPEYAETSGRPDRLVKKKTEITSPNFV
jgi:hypothetical protein